MIVKVQIPLNDDSGPALIYNQDRSFEMFVLVDEYLRTVMRGRLKAFFRVRATHTGVAILAEAPWQDW